MDTLKQSNTSPTLQHLVRFSTTEDDFLNKMKATMANTDFMPTDVFEKMSVGKVLKVYLPMGHYCGTFQMDYTWNELKHGTSTAKYSHGKPLTWYEAQTGSNRGKFNYLCEAHYDNGLPLVFARFIPYEGFVAEPYDQAISTIPAEEMALMYPFSSEPDKMWRDYGKQRIQDDATKRIQKKFKNISTIEDIKDFHVTSFFIHEDIIGDYYMVPFWYVDYTYNGENYYFAMDGAGLNVALSNPENKKQRSGVNVLNKIGAVFAVIVAVAAVFHKTGNFFTWLLQCILSPLITYAIFVIIGEVILGRSRRKRKKMVKK